MTKVDVSKKRIHAGTIQTVTIFSPESAPSAAEYAVASIGVSIRPRRPMTECKHCQDDCVPNELNIADRLAMMLEKPHQCNCKPKGDLQPRQFHS